MGDDDADTDHHRIELHTNKDLEVELSWLVGVGGPVDWWEDRAKTNILAILEA